ncbi:MAG: heparinase II/III family protein [Victivallaceae bacterium]|nr:heparinase II/III family protein [Victivallaceae bacterium]
MRFSLMFALAALAVWTAAGGDAGRIVFERVPFELKLAPGEGNPGNKFGVNVFKLAGPTDFRDSAIEFDIASVPKNWSYLRVRFYNAGSDMPCLGFVTWSVRPGHVRLLPYRAARQPWYWQTVGLREEVPDRIDRMEIAVGSAGDAEPVASEISNVMLVPAKVEPTAFSAPSDAPAAVEHPACDIAAADIERGRVNIAKFKWAADRLEFFCEQSAEIMRLPVSEIIPDGDVIDCVYCPKCGGGDDSFFLTADGEHLECRYCGVEFPSAELAEESTFEVLPGVFYPCHVGDREMFVGDDSVGNRYYLTLLLNNRKFQRSFKLHYPAYVYALTGDIKYAARVREVLLAAADRYPKNLLKFRTSFYQTPLFNYMAGRLGGWKFGDSVRVANFAAAYDLTVNSGLYSEADRLKIENDLFREFVNIIIAHRPNADVTSNAVPAHLTGVAMCAALLGEDRLIEDYVVNGESGFADFVRRNYRRDGTWTENSASYAEMSTTPFIKLVELLGRRGVDPELYRHIFSAPGRQVMPDGFLPPVNDSNYREYYRPEYAELAYRHFPTPRNLALLLRTVAPDAGSDYSLFRRDAALPPPDPAQNLFFDRSTVIAGCDWTILRPERSPRSTALLLDWGSYPNGHSHFSVLNYLYYDRGREQLFDYGYLGWAHPLRGWQVSPLAHNTVTVDGRIPAVSRQGRLEYMGGNLDVQVVSAEGANAYPGCSTLRRTLFLVTGDDGGNMLVELTRVRGGSEHLYTVHPAGRGLEPGAETTPFEWGDPASTGAKYMKTLDVSPDSGIDDGELFVPCASGQTVYRCEVPALRDRRRPDGREVCGMYAVKIAGGASDFVLGFNCRPERLAVIGDGAAVKFGEYVAAVKYSGVRLSAGGMDFYDDYTVARNGEVIFRSAPDTEGRVVDILPEKDHKILVDFNKNGDIFNSAYIFFDRRAGACRILGRDGGVLELDDDEGKFMRSGDTFRAFNVSK